MTDPRLRRLTFPSILAFALVVGISSAAAAPLPSGSESSGSTWGAPADAAPSTAASATTRGVWPWVRWHRQRIRPRFSFEQRLQVRTRRGRGVRTTRLTVRTVYHYRVLKARRSFARVEVVIDAVEAYRGDRFIGRVDRIPRRLRTVRAVVRRDGRIRFNRDVLLVGAPRLGFELLATRPHRGGFHRKRPKVLAVGRVQPRQGRVVPVRYSRLLERHRSRVIPTPLIPDDVDGFYAGVAGPYSHDAPYGRYDATYRGRHSGPPAHVPPHARRSTPPRGTTTGAETPPRRRGDRSRPRSWTRGDDVREDPRGRGARSRGRQDVNDDRDDDRREERADGRRDRAEERRERAKERRERAEDRRERAEERRERSDEQRDRSTRRSVRRVDTSRYDVDEGEMTVRRETRVRRLDDG